MTVFLFGLKHHLHDFHKFLIRYLKSHLTRVHDTYKAHRSLDGDRKQNSLNNDKKSTERTLVYTIRAFDPTDFTFPNDKTLLAHLPSYPFPYLRCFIVLAHTHKLLAVHFGSQVGPAIF